MVKSWSLLRPELREGQAADHGVRAVAVRADVAAVFDKGDVGRVVAQDVIALRVDVAIEPVGACLL